MATNKDKQQEYMDQLKKDWEARCQQLVGRTIKAVLGLPLHIHV